MILWLASKLGLSQLIVKIILCALASGAVLYGLRLWGNKQWAKGQEAGRFYAIDELTKAKQAEWQAKDAENAKDKQTNTADRRQIEIDRASLNKAFRDSLTAIRSERGSISTTVNNVPDSERNSAIRQLLRQLAAE